MHIPTPNKERARLGNFFLRKKLARSPKVKKVALYSFTASTGSKRGGSSAKAHTDYISREGKYKNIKSEEDLILVESGNMPDFVKDDIVSFWNSADNDSAVNATVYRDFRLSLQNELSTEDNIELVREFVKSELGDKHAYTFAVHESKTLDGKNTNPHVHITFSDTINDNISRTKETHFKQYRKKNPELGGTYRSRDYHPQVNKGRGLKDARKNWADLVNAKFKEKGIDKTISHLSLKEQSINREPEQKLSSREVDIYKRETKNLSPEQLETFNETSRVGQVLETRQAIEYAQKMDEEEKLKHEIKAEYQNMENDPNSPDLVKPKNELSDEEKAKLDKVPIGSFNKLKAKSKRPEKSADEFIKESEPVQKLDKQIDDLRPRIGGYQNMNMGRIEKFKHDRKIKSDKKEIARLEQLKKDHSKRPDVQKWAEKKADAFKAETKVLKVKYEKVRPYHNQRIKEVAIKRQVEAENAQEILNKKSPSKAQTKTDRSNNDIER